MRLAGQWLRDTGRLEAGQVVRVPTDAEWEYAARGSECRRFPWGDQDATPERLNYGSNIGHPTPVGIYPEGATPEGILELAGNVREWCWDWYEASYYRTCRDQGMVKNPSGPSQGLTRLVRGGSKFDKLRCVRTANRCYDSAGSESDQIGFRLVCSSIIPKL